MEFPKGPGCPHQSFMQEPFSWLKEYFETYGDLFTLELGTFGVADVEANGKRVFLTRPEQLRELYTADPDLAHAGEANRIQFFDLPPPDSSVALDGQRHARRRQLLNAVFKDVSAYTDMIRATALETLDGVADTGELSLLDAMKKISAEVMMHTVFGEHLDSETRQACNRLLDVERIDVEMEQKHQIIGEFYSFISNKVRTVAASQANEDSDDVLSILLRSETENGERLSEATICQEIALLIVGGVRTTGTGMSWAFAWILGLPEVYATLRQELDRDLAEADLTYESVVRMEYLDGVVKESLRLSPLLGTAGLRLLKADFEIDGFKLPKGTLLANCYYLLHRRPELYPEPETFEPERFIGKKLSPYEWTPFGGGMRKCLGSGLATLEMKVVIAIALQNFGISLSQASLEPEFQGVFFAPKGGPKGSVSRER